LSAQVFTSKGDKEIKNPLEEDKKEKEIYNPLEEDNISCKKRERSKQYLAIWNNPTIQGIIIHNNSITFIKGERKLKRQHIHFHDENNIPILL
jgi:hypothetical protein